MSPTITWPLAEMDFEALLGEFGGIMVRWGFTGRRECSKKTDETKN